MAEIETAGKRIFSIFGLWDDRIPSSFRDILQANTRAFPEIGWTVLGKQQVHDLIDPDFLEEFENLPRKICQADIARLFVIREHGGIYCDLDILLQSDLTRLLSSPAGSADTVLLFGEHDHCDPRQMGPRENPGHTERIFNCVFGSLDPRTSRPFWDACIALCKSRVRALRQQPEWSDTDVIWATGPDVITTVYHEWKGRVAIRKLNRVESDGLFTHLAAGSWRSRADADPLHRKLSWFAWGWPRARRQYRAGPLLSSIAIAAIFYGVFLLFGRFDYGGAVVKLGCFSVLAALLVIVCQPPRGAVDAPSRTFLRLEVVFFVALGGVLLLLRVHDYGRWMVEAPTVDIGVSTVDAVRLFFHEGQNPYASSDLFVGGPDSRFWGYKYGPAMFGGYGLAALSPNVGLKLSILAYLLGTWAVVVRLAWNDDGDWLSNAATTAFVTALLLLPERFYSELFVVGAIDILPAFLVAVCLLCVRRDAWLAAGVAAGLSLSAKVLPAAALLVLFVRRGIEVRFLVGVALGLLPLLAFVVASPKLLFDNLLVLLLIKDYDSTSLYSVVPAQLHFMFTVVQLSVLAGTVALQFHRPIRVRELTAWFLLVLIGLEICDREVHENHLVWFIPFLVLVFAWNRDRLWSGLAAVRELLPGEREVPLEAPRGSLASLATRE